MWIAKPLRSLTAPEQGDWCRVLERMRQKGGDAPLAQSLAWGRAIEAVSGQVYAVFSPEESVGGLVFATTVSAPTAAPPGLQFECINGPLLDWEDATAAPRQLAVFATAVSKLSPRFAALVLRPRWLRGQAERNLAGLPLAAAGTSLASTLRLALSPDPEPAFTPRLRRTLRATDRAGVEARWETLDSARLVEFVVAAQAFGRAHGFTVPPIFWFKALIDAGRAEENLRFALVTAQTPARDGGCQLLIAWHAREAHYLFGHEWRAAGVRAAISPSAAAHRLAIRQSAAAGLVSYDFNGTLEEPDPGHAYTGVARFKAQFGGELVRYEVPELRIEP